MQYKKLGEICEIYQPKTISSDMLISDGKYLVYGANGVIGRYDKYNHEESELLMTCRGATCGTINISKPFSWINGNAMVIHPNQDIDSLSYLKYALQSIDLSIIITGCAQPQITRQNLSPLQLPVPSLATQSRIVSELDLLTSLIDNQKKQLDELSKLQQSTFYSMFGDPVENEKEWPAKKLGEVCEKIGSGATPRGGNESYKDEGVSLIRSLNVYNGQFKYKDLAHIDEEQANALNNVILQENDVLLNITGASVARCCVVPNDVLPARVNQHVCILRTSKVVSLFLCYQIISEEYQHKLLFDSKSNASTREALPKNMVEKLPIILPPLPLQTAFAEKISAIEEMKKKLKASIAETQKMFDARMQEIFG